MKAKILLIFMFIAPIFANAYGRDFLEEPHLLQLYSLNDSSIKGIKEGKYYLNPTKISISEEGLYLHSDRFAPLALHRLFQDQNGVFVVSQYYQHRCNTCGAIYNNKPSECSVCKGASFSPYGVD